jgi:lipid-binding SYLF domain-containing protein
MNILKRFQVFKKYHKYRKVLHEHYNFLLINLSTVSGKQRKLNIINQNISSGGTTMKKSRIGLSSVLIAIIVGTMVFGCFIQRAAAEPAEQQLLVDKASVTFDTFMKDENQAWLKENLNQAKGLIIIPSLLKAGFFIGGSGGSGLLIVKDDKTGQWSQPAFYTLGAGSLGIQFGAEAAEIIMMVRTQKAVDKLFTSSFKLGGDTSIAVGPVGSGVKSNIVADILSFSRTKGAFAGISLEGSVIKTKDKWNEAYYGKAVSPVDIIVNGSVSNAGSEPLRTSVAKAAAGK